MQISISITRIWNQRYCISRFDAKTDDIKSFQNIGYVAVCMSFTLIDVGNSWPRNRQVSVRNKTFFRKSSHTNSYYEYLSRIIIVIIDK